MSRSHIGKSPRIAKIGNPGDLSSPRDAVPEGREETAINSHVTHDRKERSDQYPNELREIGEGVLTSALRTSFSRRAVSKSAFSLMYPEFNIS